ncbi:hypothetical protein GVN16_03755 [Emticicia sp. CRIBPO]|uniref:uracil-DNA glycosylase family protein n=1 Tax=Emticicia sp. CRIBPO TaxID=2683258 RepID=UPI001412DCFB|nr:uracil-DNA glycosylase family protein [Emticicia sp. CRIBPO]NBA84857.1 hypothetical protein [Emticicia sp. CRIBPO]
MYKIKFSPYIGVNYNAQNPKILIVGESHYRGEGDENGNAFTTYVVNRFAKRNKGEKRKFFTIIAKILGERVNEWLDTDSAIEIWDRLAFYNYVQEFAGDKARKRPTDEMFNESAEALEEVFQDLKPDIVVFLGKKLSYHIQQNHVSKNGVIFCYWTHPSTPKYFRYSESIDSLNEAKDKFKLNAGIL